MRRALAVAEEGWGRVAPNPMVGALVVRDGEIVAEGFHAEWGGPHAEVVALERAGSRARGATLYVTLEPCAHVGKTGPCTVAIRDAGVARVVCAMADPHPRAGGGASWLRGEGIELTIGVCEREARDLNAVYLKAFQEGRPFLALKYALSLDARLAESPGQSTRVTSGEAVVEAHRLRAGHDAVMVGIGTVIADDPLLTVREWGRPRVVPVRVVLDSSLRTPPDSRLAGSVADGPVLVFAAPEAPEGRERVLSDRGIEVVRVPKQGQGAGLDAGAVLARLWDRGVRSVLCEGGGRLGSAMLMGGHVDRLYVLIAPRLFGEPGVEAFRGALEDVPREWRVVRRAELGPVTLLGLTPAERGTREA